MTTTRSRKHKAWVVVADQPRPPFQEIVFGGVPPGVPLAVFPPRLTTEKIRLVVDAFVQNFNATADDMADYLKREDAPYAAKVHSWGQTVTGGFNPYVEAFRVDDLQVVIDHETGERRFKFTRKQPQKPWWLEKREAQEHPDENR